VSVVALDHVQIAAPPECEADVREFFGGVVGLEETPKPEQLASRGGVWFRCGEQQLHVGVEHAFAPARKAHPAFRVDDLDAVRARLVGAGRTPQDDDAFAGVRRFYVDDPFGNRLEFLEDA
jgi:catechol 2,3-dioxygenase-like lactoylglutathione lyase family enzyme